MFAARRPQLNCYSLSARSSLGKPPNSWDSSRKCCFQARRRPLKTWAPTSRVSALNSIIKLLPLLRAGQQAGRPARRARAVQVMASDLKRPGAKLSMASRAATAPVRRSKDSSARVAQLSKWIRRRTSSPPITSSFGGSDPGLAKLELAWKRAASSHPLQIERPLSELKAS